MAEQPKSSDRFSDYVNTYYQSLTGRQPGASPSGPVEFPDLPAPKQKLGFLGRTVDILSRPMRIISNPAMKAVEFPERMDTVKELRLAGDDAAATKEQLSAVGSLLASPFTGFFSDDPANKPYWSDIIERSSDVANRNDPNYVDVANNANPAVKGTVGFIGDVLLDPLWLVPGGWGIKAAKEAAKTAPKVTRGIATAADNIPSVPGVEVLPVGQTRPSLALFAQEAPGGVVGAKYELKTVRNGKESTQMFDTLAQAREALQKAQSKSRRPWVNLDEVPEVFRGTNAYKISSKIVAPADTFPAAQASQKIADDVAEATAKGATASEAVVKSLREVIAEKTITVGGKEVPLLGELNSFFASLAKAAPTPKAKPGKPQEFAKWVPAVAKDSKLANLQIAVPPSSPVYAVYGERVSLGELLKTYDATRDPAFKQAVERAILRPAYNRYVSGVKAGKGVDLIGNAATPTARLGEAAEASVAATVVRNLKNLDDAERARGAALLGEDLFKDLQALNPKAMAVFLDNIDAVLKNTGAVDAIGAVSPQTLQGRFLSLFNADDALRQAAEAQMSRSIDDVPNVTPESVAERAVRASQSAEVTDFVTDRLRALGDEGDIPNKVTAIREAVAEVLPDIIRAKLDPQYQKAVYKYRRKDALKTDPRFGEGRAVVPKEPNSGFQAELIRDLQIVLAKFYKPGPGGRPLLGFESGKPFIGDKLIREKERNALVAFELAEELLKRQGLALTINLDGVKHQITLSQAYRVVAETMNTLPSTSRWLAGAMFNAFSPVGPKGAKGARELFDGTLPFNVFADAVARKLMGGSLDDIKTILNSKVSAAGVEIVNGLADSAAAGRSIKVGRSSLSAKQMIDNIAEGIDKAGPALVAKMADNTAEYAARGLVEGKQLTAEAAEIIVDIFRNPLATAAQIRVAHRPEKVVEDLASVVPTTELGQTIAAGTVSSGIGPAVSRTAEIVENLSDGVASGNKAKVAKEQANLVDEAAQSTEDILSEAKRVADELRARGDNAADDVLDEFDLSGTRPHDGYATEGRATVTAAAAKFMDPLRRFFDSKAGMHVNEMLWGSRLFFAQGNLMAMVNKPFLQSLKTLMRNNDYAKPVVEGGKETVLQRAFKNLQNGTVSAPGTILREAEDNLRPMMARFFDQTDDINNVLLGNAFFRTGAGREAINAVMDYNAVLGRSKGVAKTPPSGIFFDQDLAVKMATEKARRAGRKEATDDEVLQELLNQWKTWDIDDPIGFMYTVNRAMVQLSAEVAFVTAFKQKAIQVGVGSLQPRKGFVKIVGGEDSRYGRLLGDEPFYMDPDAAEMFQAIDNFAKSTKQFEGGFGKFVRTTIDPITDTWKYAITLPRPGHHIRNMVGDITLTYLAEGIFGAAAATRKALQMMSLRGNYPDIDIAKAMTRAGITDIPSNGTVMSSGRFGSFTAEELFQKLFLDRGILIPARQREGLMTRQGFADEAGLVDEEVASTVVSRALEKTFGVASFGIAARGGGMEDFITGVAEGRDAFVRLQHALQLLEKAQAGKTITRGYGKAVDTTKISQDELFDLIAERVAKYHPDMSTLSVQEKKYLRRIMPFYHWNRGAIQAVTETLLMNPGRIMALNKASYNIAVAAGINPDSLYDPFPDDQLFPSFLQDEMNGPQFQVDGRYYALKPGIASSDVLNQFASGNPVDTLLDNANPLFKIPIELLTGTRLGTQSRIRDYSDFIDSSIPGINYASNISGQSVTGSLYSLLTRGSFDPQYQFEVGNKDSGDQLISLTNWLLGIGLTDYSRPSYIRIAEQEQRQALEGGDF